MNLGTIYIEAALVILAAGLALGAILTRAYLWVSRKRMLASTLLFGAVAIGLPLGCVGLALLHESLFSTWHRLQNDAVPATGCVAYEPSFWHLYATYKIDRQSLNQWIASHPWGLTRCEPDGIFQLHDGPHFRLTSCEAVYESPRGPKGNNLRVYYQDGTAYVSYIAM
jgi:hypothetical protein